MLVQPQQAATVCELDLVLHTIGSSKRAQTLDPNQPPENSHEPLNLTLDLEYAHVSGCSPPALCLPKPPLVGIFITEYVGFGVFSWRQPGDAWSRPTSRTAAPTGTPQMGWPNFLPIEAGRARPIAYLSARCP